MKVVQIPRRFVRDAWGGTETVVLETTRRLIARGVETEILCPAALASDLEEEIDGVAVFRTSYFYPYFGLKPEAKAELDRKGGNLFSFSLMRRLSREPGLDLIHLHTGKRLGAIGRHVARKRRIPYVVTVHGGVLDIPDQEFATYLSPTEGCFEWGKLLGMLYGSRRVFDDADAIICVDASEAEKMRARYPTHRVEFLPNGVDVERFDQGDGPGFRRRYGIPDDEPLLLQVSRIDHQKNQLGTVELFDQLVRRRGKGRLCFVGPVTGKKYYEKVVQQVAEAGLKDRVDFISFPPGSQELVDAYHAADLFLLPSLHEPFGIVILEAWAAGVPVVASAVGGIPSFTEDGEDILLFDPGDIEKGLAHVEAILDDPALGKRLARRGRHKAETQYDWDRITSQLLSLYEEVIAISKAKGVRR